jgi:hypothetical protein
LRHGSIRTQKVTTALWEGVSGPTFALIVPVRPSPGAETAPEHPVHAGAPQLFRCVVFAGMLSFTTTAVMLSAVVFVPLMR